MNTYLVFGRKDYQQPLVFVEKLTVNKQRDFKQSVFESTGKEGWIELVAIPENAIEHVVREGKIV